MVHHMSAQLRADALASAFNQARNVAAHLTQIDPTGHLATFATALADAVEKERLVWVREAQETDDDAAERAGVVW